MRKSLSALFTTACLAGAALAAGAQTTFDTVPNWSGGTVQSWGNPDTATYGQTFVAPADNVLTDFSFHINGGVGVTEQFKGMVFQWSGPITGHGGGATGTALFTSPSMVYNGSGNFQTVTVNTGGTVLTPGTHYVALLTVSDAVDYAASVSTTSWGLLPVGTHGANGGGGGFVFYNNGSNLGALNTSTWDTFSDFGDVAWTAHFSPAAAVPEPGSMTMMAGVLLSGLGALARRKRRS